MADILLICPSSLCESLLLDMIFIPPANSALFQCVTHLMSTLPIFLPTSGLSPIFSHSFVPFELCLCKCQLCLNAWVRAFMYAVAYKISVVATQLVPNSFLLQVLSHGARSINEFKCCQDPQERMIEKRRSMRKCLSKGEQSQGFAVPNKFVAKEKE